MKYASTFLSHSSVDKPLVEAVACELGRRGVIAWLDKNDLTPGLDLCEATKAAIQRQATICLFLSCQAVKSKWVEEELGVALKKVEVSHRIIPIYLGDPLELVKSHPLLKSRWLHPDGDRVTQLGIRPEPGKDIAIQARKIAYEVARGIYDDLKIATQNEVILYVDQRGKDMRHGELQDIPEEVKKQNAPALVFRPNLGPRRLYETLYGDEWNALWHEMETSLDQAVGSLRGADPKEIRILGNAQLGFPFFLGLYFNRNTSAHIFCYNLDGQNFDNRDQIRHAPLKGGNAHCEVIDPEINSKITPIPSGSEQEAIYLLLVTKIYMRPAVDYLKANSFTFPQYGYWVKHDHFTSNDQVMNYVADIVALLMRLKNEHGVRTLYLFCSLPFHVVPLLAANLLHVMENIVFMEYRRDLQGKGAGTGEMYVPLPSGS